jgi:hypothetical protein
MPRKCKKGFAGRSKCSNPTTVGPNDGAATQKLIADYQVQTPASTARSGGNDELPPELSPLAL